VPFVPGTFSALRKDLDESERVEDDARNLMLFSWAQELLLAE